MIEILYGTINITLSGLLGFGMHGHAGFTSSTVALALSSQQVHRWTNLGRCPGLSSLRGLADAEASDNLSRRVQVAKYTPCKALPTYCGIAWYKSCMTPY